MKKQLTAIILALVALAILGGIIGIVFASSPIATQSVEGVLDFVPDSGIRYNVAKGIFEIYNYYGITWISSGAIIDTVGTIDTISGQESEISKKADANSVYHVMQDITYLSDYQLNGNPLFSGNIDLGVDGVFDGRGFYLSGFYTHSIDVYVFSTLFDQNNGLIRNVNINAPILGGGTEFSHSFLVNKNENSGVIENCVAYGNISIDNGGKSISIGVFAYQSSGRITNCVNNINFYNQASNAQIGGIVFLLINGKIERNVNNGYMEVGDNSGGIISFAANENDTVVIDSNQNNGEILGKVGYLGGIIGTAMIGGSAFISSNINSGKISLDGEYVGGIIGFLTATNLLTFESNINKAEITSKRGIIGGCIGFVTTYMKSAFTFNSNSGKMTGIENSVGGIIGNAFLYDDVDISNNMNSGYIEAIAGNNVGGIIGSAFSYSTIAELKLDNNINSGDIKANYTIGGIVGLYSNYEGPNYIGALYAKRNINNGDLTALKNYSADVGGIIGKAQLYNTPSFIIDNVNNGKLESINDGSIGGIIGKVESKSSNEIIANTNNGLVIGNGESVGGVLGICITLRDTTIVIAANKNNADIKGTKDNVGGIIGYYYMEVYSSVEINANVNNGHVQSLDQESSYKVAGIVGYARRDNVNPTGVYMLNINNNVNNANVGRAFDSDIFLNAIANVDCYGNYATTLIFSQSGNQNKGILYYNGSFPVSYTKLNNPQLFNWT